MEGQADRKTDKFDWSNIWLLHHHLALIELRDGLFELLGYEHVMTLYHVSLQSKIDSRIHLLTNLAVNILWSLSDDVESELVLPPAFCRLLEVGYEIALSGVIRLRDVLVRFVQRQEHRCALDVWILDIAANLVLNDVCQQTRDNDSVRTPA